MWVKRAGGRTSVERTDGQTGEQIGRVDIGRARG